MKRKATRRQTVTSGSTRVKIGQSAKASIGQGGNAIIVNASEVGVVRIRP
ncbi:hypothetical protein [Paenibacillus aestuarii]|uniref:Uncharacterized protein n=1 Tax=Paenibacillus aestuarii TaxID=516965 RepID=A0ABW0K4A8_9BACL|nr:hypothetical protein [Paenibacillus aestuarii]